MPREACAPARPWIGSYPEGIAWDAKFRPALVGSLLDQAVQAYGARPCTYFMGKRLSFAEIGTLSDRVAKGLSAIGVGPGIKVGLMLPNTPTFVVFYYGVMKAGGTIVNFNPLYSLEEIEFQIRDSGTKIMVTLDLALTFEKVEAMLKRGALEKAVVASFPALLPAMKSVGFKLLQRTKLANVRASPEKQSIVPEKDLLANDGAYAKPGITPDAIAVLQYTGGTTGTPKGAMLTHGNLTINVGQVRAWQNRQATERDRIVGVLPLFHVFAMTSVMNLGVASGMEMILLP
jgi:long-chain acyl-CoA synthetase